MLGGSERRPIVELSEQLEVAEQQLSRLRITRETMGEIFGEYPEADGQQERSTGSGSGTEPKTAVSQSKDYGEIMEVLAEADHGLRISMEKHPSTDSLYLGRHSVDGPSTWTGMLPG